MVTYEERKKLADNFRWWCEQTNAVNNAENVIHYLFLHGFLNEDRISLYYRHENEKESGD